MYKRQVFASYVAQDDKKGASKVASSVITLSVGTFLLVGVAARPFAPQLVRLFAPGFSGEIFDSAVTLTRLFFPAFALPLLAAPVSYTHLMEKHHSECASALDCYGNRQCVRVLDGNKSNHDTNASNGCPAPVSYTHLDVYKRQGYNDKILNKGPDSRN